ncbi:MAG: S9 family peptidase, partial [Mariniphaga sp.]|nr:S9 family peptidase [Mariniphaga sp.]
LGEETDANQLPVTILEYKRANEILIRAKNKRYLFNAETYTLATPERSARENGFEKKSPDEKWIAFTENYNLFIKSSDGSEIKQLSFDGKKGYEYASWYGWDDMMEGENGERPRRFRVDWSEDSQWIFANVCDLRTAEKMFLLDWSIDTLYRPKLLSYYRGSPGDTGMVYLEPVFFNVKSGKTVRPQIPPGTHINAISVQWSETPGKVYLYQPVRGFQQINLFAFDLENEVLDLLYSESSKTNIDNFTYRLVEKSDQIFFLSEKSGWRQLYSLNLKTKQVAALSGGEYYINNIERVDTDSNTVFFTASGKEEGLIPYNQNLYSISFDGQNLKRITQESLHHLVDLSPDGKYVVDNFSTVETPTTTVLRDASSGKVLVEMGRAELTALENWSPPQIFEVVAGDEETPIYGALWKPTHFNPEKKYPIIDNSYTGPHTQVFPKDFRSAFNNQALAELGFIVMAVDGRGSAGRSKAFHNFSYKNLGGALEDHIHAMRQLAKRYPWIDTTRVGIFGHSAGGYDAGRAVLKYSDFYKVAVASSADHDHRMEKAWWPEMYMGWPIDSAYHLQSNITNATNLKGKLLLVHGGIDENVNPSATFKLAEALVKADKQFDMLIFPSQRHGYQGWHSKYFTKMRWNYFVEHLQGEQPVWEINWE